MAKNKTTQTPANVTAFINSFADTEQKKKDSFALLALMQKVSGHKPVMWGASIVGFGKYNYTYDSGHSGEAPLIGFSPRKAAISLYVFTGTEEQVSLLNQLGRFKMGKACIYVRKLSDISEPILTEIMKDTIRFVSSKYKTE